MGSMGLPELILIAIALSFIALVVGGIVALVLILQKRDQRKGEERPPAPPPMRPES